MTQKVIRDFSGGLNRQVASHLINDNQGTTYINIDNTKGTLTPIVRKQPLQNFNSEGLPVYLDSFEKWQGLPAVNNRPDYVEFRDEVYYLDSKGNLRFIPRARALGNLNEDLLTLSIALDQDSIEPSWNLRDYSQKRNAPTPNPNTTFTDTVETITYTYRSSRFQLESNPYVATELKFSTDNQILTFNNIQKLLDSRPVGFERVSFYILVNGSYLRAFEIVGNDNIEGGFNRLAEALPALPDTATDLQKLARARQERTEIRAGNFEEDAFETNGDLKSASQIIYTWFNPGAQEEPGVDDTTATQFEIEGTALTTVGNAGAPTTLHSLTESGGRLYALQDQVDGGSRLYYSEIGKGYAWAVLNFISVPEKASAISRVYIRSDDQVGAGGLLIHSVNQTWLMTRTATVLRPSTENTPALTTLSHSLVQVSANQGCVSSRSVQSINGIPFWVSRDGICAYAEGGIQLLTKKISGYWNTRPSNILSSTVYNNAYYVLMSNGLTYIIDLDYNIHKQEMYGQDISFITAGDNYFVGLASEILYNLDPRIGIANDPDIMPNRSTMFFKSKEFNIGAFNVNQTFSEFFITGRGKVKVTVFIDGVEINRGVQDLSTHPKKIQLPHERSRGSFIQFQFEGDGIVNDIRWNQDISEAG